MSFRRCHQRNLQRFTRTNEHWDVQFSAERKQRTIVGSNLLSIDIARGACDSLYPDMVERAEVRQRQGIIYAGVAVD